jgi:two-component system sensor histidine kinase UhpB
MLGETPASGREVDLIAPPRLAGADQAKGRSRLPRRLSLVARVFIGNAVVITIAVLGLALTPASIPAPTTVSKTLVILAGLSTVLGVNLLLLRRAAAPLGRLADAMGRVEPLQPGERVPVYGHDQDVSALTVAFNDMLERLERERRESVRRSLLAQEEERGRVARELHDEIGQSLTAVVLQVDRLGKRAPPELRAEAEEARETARASLLDVRRIARRLRPEALDELGILNALVALADRISEHGELSIDCRLARDLPDLTPEQELVIYRVAQEGLTNTLRHADASSATVGLERAGGRLMLKVQDDGRGLGEAVAGSGLQGMRERAVLVGGVLSVRTREAGGTEVRLELPLTQQ